MSILKVRDKDGKFVDVPVISGRPASIKVGEVKLLEPNSEPTIENVGTEYDAIFNFGIPKGEYIVQGEDFRLDLSDYVKQKQLDKEIQNRQQTDNNLQSQIKSLASGSPLVANSISEMTDTSKVYVNTTDGNWYYYDGSNWNIGGIYQSTSESNEFKNDIAQLNEDISDISTQLGSANLLNIDKISLNKYIDTDGSIRDEIATWFSDFIPVEENSLYLATQKYTKNASGRAVLNNIYVAYYDEYKNFISRTSIFNIVIGSTNTLIEIIENAKYIRLQRYILDETYETLTSREYMLVKTTNSTAVSDERLPYVSYNQYKKVGYNNLTKELTDKINEFDEFKEKTTDDINSISEIIQSKNLLDVSKISVKTVINDNGEVENSENYFTTDYIELEKNSKYILTMKSTYNSWGRAVPDNMRLTYYDENKNFISRTEMFNLALYSPQKFIELIEGAKYIRLLKYITTTNTLESLIESQYMIIETTSESCLVDERLQYIEYYRARKVTENNFSPDLITTINNLKSMSGHFNLLDIKNRYRYLVTTFIGSEKNGLILLGTNDLRKFDLVRERGIYNITKGRSLRDPAIIKIDDYYYLIYTICEFSPGNSIGFCRTKDFLNFEELDNLEVKDSEDSSIEMYQVWAPGWFRDVDGKLYILSACKEENESFSMYINEYNPQNHELLPGHKTNINSIDGHVYYENGKYYMAVGGAHIWKSDTLLGEWVGITNNNLNAVGYEANFIVKLDNGKWRLYIQQLVQNFGSSHMMYADAETLDGTWTDLKEVSYTDKALNYARELNGGNLNSEYFHWNVYDFNEHNDNNNNIASV